MRRSSLEEGLRWLEQAREDLKWAEDLAQRGGYYLACFLSQQIAEKVLKAFLYAQGLEVVLGHSIARLGAEAVELDGEFKDKVRRWSVLDGYYIPTRYPNGLPDGIPAQVYNQEAAQEAVRLAAEAVAFVAQKLEQPGGRGRPRQAF
ncbi:MAG: HEPN domain-containing protein [Firmicutes bacterium]|nr:HEPN domain-containing protein [Bacillota bacterium]